MDEAGLDERLAVLASLTDGWDGYRARAIPRPTIEATRVVGRALIGAGLEISIVPTSAETLAIEWRAEGADCCAEIDAATEEQ